MSNYTCLGFGLTDFGNKWNIWFVHLKYKYNAKSMATNPNEINNNPYKWTNINTSIFAALSTQQFEALHHCGNDNENIYLVTTRHGHNISNTVKKNLKRLSKWLANIFIDKDLGFGIGI